MSSLCAAEISITPLKKPIINEESESKKMSQGILKPKSKPSKKVKIIETIIIKKDVKKNSFLVQKANH